MTPFDWGTRYNSLPWYWINYSPVLANHVMCLQPRSVSWSISFNAGSCVAAGLSGCCKEGSCIGFIKNITSSCFCDEACYKLNDCCDDITEIHCTQDNGTYMYVLLSLIMATCFPLCSYQCNSHPYAIHHFGGDRWSGYPLSTKVGWCSF